MHLRKRNHKSTDAKIAKNLGGGCAPGPSCCRFIVPIFKTLSKDDDYSVQMFSPSMILESFQEHRGHTLIDGSLDAEHIKFYGNDEPVEVDPLSDSSGSPSESSGFSSGSDSSMVS